MPKIFFSFLLLCFFTLNVVAQNKGIDAQAASIPDIHCTSVDALASFIKENFTTDTARIRAIYIWTTHNINYDVALLRAREKRPDTPPPTIAEVLNTRKGVCQGYSELFVALCKAVKINAIVVPGYTKKQGKVSLISHAWVAASLGNEWYLFDPTWGAGYLKDEQFYRKFSNAFYRRSPADFINDHMPFDPMYQFLPNPLTHREFMDGTPVVKRGLFNYADSLKQYSQLSSVQQYVAELRRLERAGIQNDLLRQRQLMLKANIESNASQNAFNEGGRIFNSTFALYKEYTGHKNKQFSTIADNDLRQMVSTMEQNVKVFRSMVPEMKTRTASQAQDKNHNVATIDRFWVQLLREKQFTEQYLRTDKLKRMQLFMKR